MTMWQDVHDFHSKFEHPTPNRKGAPDKDWIEKRKTLLREEVNELIEAMDLDILPKVAHEAVDVIYVAVGVLVAYGLPLKDIWKMVHLANMRKTTNPEPNGKPIKPNGWVNADWPIADYLENIR